MHGLAQMSFWILVVDAARPCKTLSSLLTVMILLPLLAGEEERVEGCPGWDNDCRTPGKERLVQVQESWGKGMEGRGRTCGRWDRGRSSNRGSNTSWPAPTGPQPSYVGGLTAGCGILGVFSWEWNRGGESISFNFISKRQFQHGILKEREKNPGKDKL